MMKKRHKLWVLLVCWWLAAIPASAANPPKLIVLGDSLSVGLFASELDGGFAYRLAERGGYTLDLLGGTHTNVCGVQAAWDTWQASGQPAPDVVVIEVGLNDIGTYLNCMPEAQWPAAYGALIDDVKSSGAKVIAANLFWAGLPGGSTINLTAQRYNGHIAYMAGVRGVPVANLWAATAGCVPCLSQPGQPSVFGPYYEGDGFHPSDYGHQVIANTIYKAIFPHRVFYPAVFVSPVAEQ